MNMFVKIERVDKDAIMVEFEGTTSEVLSMLALGLVDLAKQTGIKLSDLQKVLKKMANEMNDKKEEYTWNPQKF